MIEKEAEPLWFARWKEDLPSPKELMPLSQSLITLDLALAFDISASNPSPDFTSPNFSLPPEPIARVGDSDDPSRFPACPRLVWTPQLHKRFVDAVDHLGNKNAVPKTIMQLMSVEGLTRENVASHLQKYRIYRNRVHIQSSSGAVGRWVDARRDIVPRSSSSPAITLSLTPFIHTCKSLPHRISIPADGGAILPPKPNGAFC